MRSSLLEAKLVCGPVFTYCTTDPRLVTKINEVQQRLLNMGKWVGTYQHYRFCVASGCITLPRQLETIEKAAMCNWPVEVRNEWYEYISDGFGLRDGACVGGVIDKGDGWVAFDDVVGANKVLRVYSDTPEAAGATILLQFWNANGMYVRTQYPTGTWIDGERVAISATQTNTVNVCMPGSFVGVQKPITNGHVFIYEYDTVLLTQRLLAMYEPDETRPNYRRYILPFATQTGDCDTQVVDIIAKRRFIPALQDNDWLIIGNLGALKLGCMALRKEENNLMAEAAAYWYGGTIRAGGFVSDLRGARGILDDELRQFIGDGMQPVPQLFDEIVNAEVCTY